MLVKAGRMAVNSGRMVTTDAAGCCCGGVCEPWADATTCYIVSPCNDPSTCTNGCTARPGSVFVLRNYDVSWPSGPFLRRVQLSNVVLKLKQKTIDGTIKYRWQAEATASVTRKDSRFGTTFPVPVCVILELTGSFTWRIRLQSAPFSNGPVTGGYFRANYTVFDVSGKTDNCGDCFGGLTDPITYNEGHLGAGCDQQDATTIDNWTGGWFGDLYGTLATDANCVGCTSVYAEFKPCKPSDTRVFWSRVSGCTIQPGTCLISSTPGVCIASTGTTFPIDSVVPPGVTIINEECGDPASTFPKRTCCACRSPHCSDTRGGSSSSWPVDRCTPPTETSESVKDVSCPCHQSATATTTISGGGVYNGTPFTISGSATGTKADATGWTFTGSVTTSLSSGGGPQTVPISASQNGVPTWNIFPLGSPFEGPSTQSNSCGSHTVTGGFVSPPLLTGSMTQTTTFTYNAGDCGGMACECGASGGGVSNTAEAIDKLDAFFGGFK